MSFESPSQYPIKILHVVSVDKENYYLNNLVEHTSPADLQFSFVTFAGKCEFGRSLEKRGYRVYYLDSLSRKLYPRAFWRLWSILRKESPDIIHTHLFDASLMGLTIAKLQKRKTVLTRHHSDAIHAIASPLKRSFYLGLEHYINSRSDRIIAPSQMVRDYLVDRENVPSEKVSIIPYGQTTERFDAVTKEQIAAIRSELKMDGSLALVNVSRLFHRKGHVFLFEALARILSDGINANLYLVGDGNYQPQLERICADLGITERVKFLGWRSDALVIVAAADIIVHPSLEDALSSAVIEALMLEKPIVATDISGVADSLGSGKYGKIVSAADSIAFCNGLAEVIENVAEYKNRAENGKKFLLNYMDAANVSNKHRQLYEQLV